MELKERNTCEVAEIVEHRCNGNMDKEGYKKCRLSICERLEKSGLTNFHLS